MAFLGLGDLFEDEDRGFQPGQNDEKGKTRECGPPVPPSPRLSSQLCGIYNQGATCYLNSLVQTLLMTPEFRESLFQLGEDDLGQLEDKDRVGSKVRVIPIELQNLFAELLLLEAQGVRTDRLTDSFGWNNNEQFIQHDVQELNRILFSAIEDSLVGTSGQDLIKSYYRGVVVNQIVCQNCGRISEREEDFLDLCEAVAGLHGLENALNSCYVQTEHMTDSNQYRCDNCNKLVDAKKGAKIRRLPPILTFSILRFSFDYQKMERFKDTSKFVFHEDLDMSPYVENMSSAGDLDYELFSVVIHRGSSHGGHYHAYLRDIDGLGHWSPPEEEEIQIASDPSTGIVDFIECDSPGELLEIVLSKGSQQGMPVDKLCSEIVKQTGVSWNKRFKKQFGPINKFLKKQDDKFVFNADTNWVHLRCYDSVYIDESGELESAAATAASASNSVTSSPSNNKEKSSASPRPEVGHCWFDFDDSRVRPINTRDLEKQFSGKESAYMLFYRQKNRRRDPLSMGNRAWSVPDALIEKVALANHKLQLDREEYEADMNRWSLSLLFSTWFTFADGGIHTTDETRTFPDVSVDRRKPVAELVAIINDLWGELVPETVVIHTAKRTPAGFHLYNCISGDMSQSIMSTQAANNSYIFIWDGRQVGGHVVPTGPTHEPVLLRLSLGGEGDALSQGFRKSLTTEELLQILGDMSGIPASRVKASRVVTKNDDTTLVRVTAEDFPKTLAELKMADGEQLVVEDAEDTSSSLAEEAASKQKDMMSFIVVKRCQESQNGIWPVFHVETRRESTIEELKAVILSHPDCGDVTGPCRLRVEDDSLGLKPPLHEAQLLSSAGLTQGSRLVIEPGTPPETNQITLTFGPGGSGGDLADLELIVDKSMKVESCLRKVLKQAKLAGDEWHMRRTNWCGEAAAVLDDLDSTLTQLQIRDGEHLLLLEGKLPPMGHVKVPVWLYPTPPLPGSRSGVNQPGLLAWITGGIQGLLGGASAENQSEERTELEAIYMGDVIISKDATLDDLRIHIMTLDQMENVPIPMPQFLRVRLVENKRLSTVLKDSKQTMQRLKVANGSILGVQVLHQEEELSANEMVLMVRQRVPESQRDYLSPQELVWETSQGATPNSLRQRVADLCLLPLERVALAKHWPEKCEWQLIEEHCKPHQKHGKDHKGKKRGRAKVNLKHAPYHLKDGDTIGVKDLLLDPLKEDDFSTADDVAGREKLRQEAEEKRKRREELRQMNASFGGGGGKKAEVGIKIHVGNFR